MTAFQYDDYKEFIRSWIQAKPSKGRGEVAKLAGHLNISPSLVSAILTGDRQFSMEHAVDLAEYLNLTTLETEYFLSLVSLEKSGSEKLKKYWRQQKKEILKRSEQIKSRLIFQKSLSEENKNQYYSHVIYSYIRVLGTLKNGVSRIDLARKTKFDERSIGEAVEFLIDCGLINESQGFIKSTDQTVHINKETIHYLRHHLNWRIQQLNQISSSTNQNVTYTFPCTLNESDFDQIKQILLTAIARSHEIVKASPAQEMACLTIDWIKYSFQK
jgi:uncharacterized protein (TIGR02147 family)